MRVTVQEASFAFFTQVFAHESVATTRNIWLVRLTSSMTQLPHYCRAQWRVFPVDGLVRICVLVLSPVKASLLHAHPHKTARSTAYPLGAAPAPVPCAGYASWAARRSVGGGV